MGNNAAPACPIPTYFACICVAKHKIVSQDSVLFCRFPVQ